MTKKHEQVNSRMKLLLDSYKRQLPNKIREIETAWNTIRELKSADYSNPLRDIIRALHTLGGTASTFGYVKLGIVAHRAERDLKFLQEMGEVSAGLEKSIAQCITEMKELCQTLETANEAGRENGNHLGNMQRDSNRTIVLVDDDQWFVSNLSLKLNCFGYEVISFLSLQDMENALPTLDVACFIMDLSFPEGMTAGAEAVRRLWKAKNYSVPVIFLSQRNDVLSRLKAVRAGSDAYFLKPVRIVELIDKLDQLTLKVEEIPYKVLVIDDDDVVGAYHALILEQAGMSTRLITDPMQILDDISEFNPDLILMDLDMPKCNGHELSKVIRQVPAYFRIPIVFLSGETDPELQMKAMETGGDDFLTKPIEPGSFIASIRTRAERMRVLRMLMERDGLSGLYNHSMMMEKIELSFLHAVRNKQTLTLGIIDLDCFKKINDTYGHATGDMVIVIISRLLEQRLRKSDIIGRVGGEEFAFIMPKTTREEAYDLIEEIRKIFEQIMHEAPGGSFTATFSCGLASSQEANDAASLYDVADMALYKAKSRGRNQTCCGCTGEERRSCKNGC